ncbi:MAG: hypothetical protein AAGI01_07270, partial [Myxococcota bacterium]
MKSSGSLVEVFNRTIVTLYKLVGFVILTSILFGLFAFFVVKIFMLFDRTAAAPLVLSPQHEHVVDLSARLAEQTVARDALLADRALLGAEAEQANERGAMLDALLADLEAAVAAEADRALNEGPEGLALARLSKEFSAEGASSPQDVPLTRATFELKRSHAELKLERASLSVRIADLQRRRDMLGASIARYDKLIRELSETPYLRALEREVTVTFSPYENLDNMIPGAPVYGCNLYIVGCKKVGQV